MASTKMVRGYNWNIIAFFAVTTAVALIGTPLYLYRYGISFWEILLTLFFVVATGMSITVGYHRLYAHSAFKTNPFVEFLVLFFGAAAFEQPALIWCSGHRDHHRYVDTEQDPYSIKKGFWYAHIGWMTLWKQEPNFDNVPDLMKNKMLMNQHKHYIFWAAGAGILLPVLLGALSGHALGAFILTVCLRLTFVYHATFCINSVCHTFGNATYDIDATAKDHWFVAILTNGEGYHNYHHHFPTDYRNGVRWYHWDPSKWAIALLAKMGWATALRKTPVFQILRARLAAQKTLVSRSAGRLKGSPRAMRILDWNHRLLEQKLQEWEASRERASVEFERRARIVFETRLRRWNLWTRRLVVSA